MKTNDVMQFILTLFADVIHLYIYIYMIDHTLQIKGFGSVYSVNEVITLRKHNKILCNIFHF